LDGGEQMSAYGTPGQPAYLPPPPPATDYVFGHRYASLLSRFAAALIDILVLLVVALVVAIPFGLLALASLTSPNAFAFLSAWLFGPLTLIMFGLWILYFTYLEGSTGQTLGKRMFGLRVLDLKTGRPPDYGKALVRTVLRIIDWLPGLYFLGFVVAALTARKQRLGDLLADTVVVAG
jgi:uncharacterized RDD family membrane protein YckC